MAPRKSKRKLRCILCGVTLTAAPVEGFWLHEESEGCGVRVADKDGVSLDDDYFVEAGDVYDRNPPLEEPATPEPAMFDVDATVDMSNVIDLNPASAHVSAEWALEAIFQAAGVPRLGGASGDRGWSSFSTYQKCPHLWKRRYIDTKRGLLSQEPSYPALEIGTLIHVFLAVRDAGVIDATYPLTMDSLHEQLVRGNVTPDYLHEAWRVVRAYEAYYRLLDESWRPLAVEHHVVDPKTGQSCRIDKIWYLDTPLPGLPAGTYLVDYKSSARFDYATLNGWKNDGEIIGLWDLYERTHMRRRFGELQGILVDILGKQKAPNFHRTWIFPSRALVRDHRTSLKIWGAAIETSKATGIFPRARAACTTKFGQLCDEFDRCAQDEASLGDASAST